MPANDTSGVGRHEAAGSIVKSGNETGERKMGSRRISLGGLIWIIIGIVVAASRGLLSDLSTGSQILSAILAIIAWPLVLLGVHVGI